MRARLAIGDFSRMTHLSVKALRHYHGVGLLTPAEIDPSSGYRFYEPGQVPIAQVIRRFRDLGMPLDQIRDVLQAPDAGARNRVIVAHMQRMESQLAATPRPPPDRGSTLWPSGYMPDTGGSMAGDNQSVMGSGGEDMGGAGEPPPFDTSVAHVARVYNYWLGGKDNFAADRAAGEQAIKAFPGIPLSARSNRAFLARTVRFLAGEAGIRQFLDIGTGIPSANNTHEVAQSVAPTSRVVYVDNDPVVLTHARALLASDPAGATDYIDADMRDPQRILAQADQLLDFSRPVALMLMAVLQHLDEADSPYQIVQTLVDASPPGSYLAVSHPAKDIDAEAMAKMADSLNKMMAEKVTFRDRSAVARFFDGLELVEPGLVQASKWRPTSESEAASPAALWGGVARRP
jgi:DNA-binding transcriptional MerR regulator